MQFYKNGVAYKSGNYVGSTSWCSATAMLYLNGSTDYVEMYLIQTTGYAQYTVANGTVYSFFQGAMVRAA